MSHLLNLQLHLFIFVATILKDYIRSQFIFLLLNLIYYSCNLFNISLFSLQSTFQSTVFFSLNSCHYKFYLRILKDDLLFFSSRGDLLPFKGEGVLRRGLASTRPLSVTTYTLRIY